jgi:hypothetical protein
MLAEPSSCYLANAVLFCITLYDGEYYLSFPITCSCLAITGRSGNRLNRLVCAGCLTVLDYSRFTAADWITVGGKCRLSTQLDSQIIPLTNWSSVGTVVGRACSITCRATVGAHIMVSRRADWLCRRCMNSHSKSRRKQSCHENRTV